MKKNITYLLSCLLFCIAIHVKGQTAEPKKNVPLTRILIIFDASYSMIGEWENDSKIQVAKKLLGELLDSLDKKTNLELALRCYGHQSKVPPQDCNDTRLEIPFAPNNASQIKHRIKSIIPKGTTPIAKSLAASVNDFPACTGSDCRNFILIITDGLEECDGDPCVISKELQKKGIVLKPYIIGIGNTDLSSLECIGTFFNANKEESFRNVLNVIVNQVLNKTTCQINLLDNYKKPTETNVPITFYDCISGKIKYNFIHTLNSKGIPDTLAIDHMLKYKIVIHTIPELTIDSAKLNIGQHNIFSIDAQQGFLELKIETNDPFKGSLPCIIRKSKEDKTLHIQNFSTTNKYLIGNYDLEVLTLPRLYLNNIEVKPNHTTTVKIPQSGLINIHLSSPGHGSIFKKENGKLSFVCKLDENNLSQTFMLLPGDYLAVYRNKYARESTYTNEVSFTIKSGMPTTIKF